MSDATIALLVLGCVIALFVWNRLSVGTVAVLTVLALWATGLLELDEATAGFGDPVIVFIAALFVVSEGIDSAGITTWAGQKLLEQSGESRARLIVALMLLSAVMTALISLNGSVAALIPMAVVIALRTSQPSSRLLMPMVYAGSAGALIVLMGSPVNVITSDASRDLGLGGFSFFEFAWVGLPILVGTVLLGVTLSPRVLPERVPSHPTPDLSRHAELLSSYYALDGGFYRLRVREGSPLIGLRPDELDLTGFPGVSVIGLQAADDEPQPVRDRLRPDDVLVVSGSPGEIGHLAVDLLLAVAMRPLAVGDEPGSLVTREMGVVEVVIPPRSTLEGETVFPGMRRTDDLVILAVTRLGRERNSGMTELSAGDALLVYGSWPSVDLLVHDSDVLVVDSPDRHRRQAVALGPKAAAASSILGAMVVLLAFGLVPPAVAGLMAALAMVLTKVVSSPQAYRAISWETLVLVGGLIPLSTALTRSGAADQIADRVVDIVGSGSPRLLMVVLFVLIAVLGLVISNTATVLIALPITVAAAGEYGISAQPLLMLTAVAASAALLTPVQTPANLMIMAPGGYRFGDYWRLGLPIIVWWLIVCLVVIPLVWPF